MATKKISDYKDKKRQRDFTLTEDRCRKNVDTFTEYVSFWRAYPDIFIDMMKGPESKFNFFFYQRIFLRAAMRHKYFYGVFPRAFSKSFLSIMLMMIRCVLYPGVKLFITSGGKEQAAGIAKEKVEEICDLLPFFKKEIDWKPGQTQFGKDYVRVVFKNGSRFDVVAAKESSRGGRRHGGLIDEVILVDGEKFSSVILPLMNVSRRAANGEVDPDDKVSKSQVYITSAGFRDHFSYNKLIQLLIWQIVKPGSAFVMGGSWRTPVKMGLLDRNFVSDLKQDGTFNEVSFNREYESVWAGSAEAAFFNGDQFDKHRALVETETQARAGGKHYYVFGIDVGRNGCQSVITVFKNVPQPEGVGIKNLVNIYTIESEHFGVQALFIKRLFNRFKPEAIAIDANGLGTGLVDFLVVKTTDEETGEVYPAYGVINDEKNQYKKLHQNEDFLEKNVLYLIKANPEINSEGYANIVSQMGSGKLKFLIDERTKKAKVMDTKVGRSMSAEKRAEELRPFVLTSILKEEMMNMTNKGGNRGVNLEALNKSMPKDKLSAMMYGLYFIKQKEDADKKKKKINISDMMLYN